MHSELTFDIPKLRFFNDYVLNDILGSSPNLGLSIAGGTETVLGCILVHEVYPGSPAHSDGRIQAGDRILAVNGTDISGYSHNQASEVLSKTKGVVRLKIVRDDQQDGLEVIKVRLNKVNSLTPMININNANIFRFPDKDLA